MWNLHNFLIINMKKVSIILLLIIASVSAVGQSSGVRFQRAMNKINQSLYYINSLYVDSVNIEKITEEAIKEALAQLDPHSSYISAEDVKAMNEPLVGNFEGIGIEFAIIKDTLTVQAVVAGGPSEKIGLLPGDKIVTADGEGIASIGLTNEDVFKILRGEKGSVVKLDIVRKGVDEVLQFSIVRDKIPLNSVESIYEPQQGVLYIKLSRFAADSHSEIVEALSSYKNSTSLKGVILDLRGNSGGYLPTAINIANEFLRAGDLIVYTEGRAVPRMQENADGTGLYTRGPLVVMIDENSASASEIVAGAVQDQDRGVVVGRRSFGKGLVQNAIPLDDGSEIRLTIARYHTPSGRVIQSPYEEGNSEKYYRDFYERYARGESFAQDSIHLADSLKYKTLRKGRVVYGGGGIMPDVFVPADTTYFSDYYANLIRNGVVIEFTNLLNDEHRQEWKEAYPTFDSFNSYFVVNDKLLDELQEFAKQKGIEPSADQFEKSKGELMVYIKALLASNLFSRDLYYRVMNENSPELKAALEAIKEQL